MAFKTLMFGDEFLVLFLGNIRSAHSMHIQHTHAHQMHARTHPS